MIVISSRALLRALAFAAGLATTSQAWASEPPADVLATVNKLFPGIGGESVSETPVAGLYQVTVGGRILYFSGDGKFVFRGDIIEVASRTNLTERSRRDVRQQTLRDVEESEMIVFRPQNAKYQVTVFTDVDCGYCAKLHNEMADYNELGIAIRYLAFPRAGVGSASHRKMVSVWCADDPHQAIGLAKARRPVEPKTCPNPVERHLEIGRMLGVSGTPTIVFDDGQVIPGYVNAKELLAQLKGN